MHTNNMNEKISVILPTRERPAELYRFLKSLEKNTSDKKNIEIIIYIDEDDASDYYYDGFSFQLKTIVGKRQSMGGYNSSCYSKSNGDIIILLNDDVVVKTANWDNIVREIHLRYKDQIYLAYGNDLHKGRSLSTFPILGRLTCETMVQPFPKDYFGALIDYHIFDVFKRLEKKGYDRIIYRPELIFEHMHFRAGKAEADITYRRRNRYLDDEVFIRLSDLRSIQAKRLLQIIENAQMSPYKTTYCCFKKSSILGSWLYLFKLFAMNRDLPWRWRIFLFAWLYGRVLAARGYLTILGFEKPC